MRYNSNYFGSLLSTTSMKILTTFIFSMGFSFSAYAAVDNVASKQAVSKHAVAATDPSLALKRGDKPQIAVPPQLRTSGLYHSKTDDSQYTISSKQPLPDNIRFLLASGNSGIKVYLEDGAAHPFYQIRTPKVSGNALVPNIFMKGNKLVIISALKSHIKRKVIIPEVIIAVKSLQGISIKGKVSFKASNLGDDVRGLYADSPWPVYLSGKFAPSYIADRGHGLLSLRWVDGSDLNVSASNNTRMELDGKATFLRASAYNHSFIDGRYLMVKNCYVHSVDHSLVTLHVAGTLHGFAYNHSQVLYYKIPKHISRVTRNSGNILQMTDII